MSELLGVQNCESWKVPFGSDKKSSVTLVIEFISNKHVECLHMPGAVLRAWDVSANNSIPVRGDS